VEFSVVSALFGVWSLEDFAFGGATTNVSGAISFVSPSLYAINHQFIINYINVINLN